MPVAVAVESLQRRSGPAGEFYRDVVLQRRGMHLDRSTQGHYVCTADGTLLRGSNHGDTAMFLRHLRSILARHVPEVVDLPDGIPEEEPGPPEGTTLVEVFTKTLRADWPDTDDEREEIRRRSLGRGFLWITAGERAALAASPPAFPASLARRLARFHVVDNTRGSGLQWSRGDVRVLDMALAKDGTLSGRVVAATEDDRRGVEAEVAGEIVARDGDLERFDLAMRATFRGDGKWSTGAPPDPYVVGIALRLAESDLARRVPPSGADGRIEQVR